MATDTKKVIDLLNAARARELTAILTYMIQHHELEDQDYGKLAKVMKTTGIAEMKHAEAFAARLIFLGGVPTAKPDAEIKKGQKIADMLATDIGLEDQAVKMYNEAAAACAELQDNVSRELFEKILKEEDEHLNMFENIKDHVDKLGDVYITTLTGGTE